MSAKRIAETVAEQVCLKTRLGGREVRTFHVSSPRVFSSLKDLKIHAIVLNNTAVNITVEGKN
jgi:hypothetical protein